MITRALRLLEELGDLRLVSLLQEVCATQETRLLTTRQERDNSDFLAEPNRFSLVVIDSTFD